MGNDSGGIVVYKNFSKDQGINKDQGIQAPKAKLPRGADAEIGERVAAGNVADEETTRIEEANEDEVAAGRLNPGPIIGVFQKRFLVGAVVKEGIVNNLYWFSAPNFCRVNIVFLGPCFKSFFLLVPILASCF